LVEATARASSKRCELPGIVADQTPRETVAVHLQYGNLAAWVGAVGTVGVLSIALRQLGILRRESEARQASLVSAWISGTKIWAAPKATGLSTEVEVSFRNVSTQPIGRLLFEIALGPERGRGAISPLPPDGMTKTASITFKELPQPVANARPRLDIWFTDESGHPWFRPHAGPLQKGTPPAGAWGIGLSVGLPTENP
jgi:hypothetical protein